MRRWNEFNSLKGFLKFNIPFSKFVDDEMNFIRTKKFNFFFLKISAEGKKEIVKAYYT